MCLLETKCYIILSDFEEDAFWHRKGWRESRLCEAHGLMRNSRRKESAFMHQSVHTHADLAHWVFLTGSADQNNWSVVVVPHVLALLFDVRAFSIIFENFRAEKMYPLVSNICVMFSKVD